MKSKSLNSVYSDKWSASDGMLCPVSLLLRTLLDSSANPVFLLYDLCTAFSAGQNLKFVKVSSNMYCSICDRNMPQTTYNLAFQCRQKDCDYDVCLSLGSFICTACGATESQTGRQFNLRGLSTPNPLQSLSRAKQTNFIITRSKVLRDVHLYW